MVFSFRAEASHAVVSNRQNQEDKIATVWRERLDAAVAEDNAPLRMTIGERDG
jgi:hypothetical protein